MQNMPEVGRKPVSELMTKDPEGVDYDMPLEDVLDFFADKKYNVVPVFRDGKIVGEIFHLDLLKICVDPKDMADEVIEMGFGFDEGYFARTAGELMSETTLDISSSKQVQEAAALMLRNEVKSLLVKGEDDEIVGVITEKDILEAMFAENKKLKSK